MLIIDSPFKSRLKKKKKATNMEIKIRRYNVEFNSLLQSYSWKVLTFFFSPSILEWDY